MYIQLKDYLKIESTGIDFKESVEYRKPKSWLKSVSAFANTNGGFLLFGIRDNDKMPVGLEDSSSDSEKISELINTKILPIPRYELNAFTENSLKNKEYKKSMYFLYSILKLFSSLFVIYQDILMCCEWPVSVQM